MKIKVVDTPDNLFEYTADAPPKKGAFISYKDRGYTVSYVSHHIDEVTDTGRLEEVYAVFRDGCLGRWLFYSVQEARHVTKAWLDEYNIERPHGALAGVPPARYVEKLKQKRRNAA